MSEAARPGLAQLGVFRAEQLEEYHFQHMVGLDALVVYNTREGLYLWRSGKKISNNFIDVINGSP